MAFLPTAPLRGPLSLVIGGGWGGGAPTRRRRPTALPTRPAGPSRSGTTAAGGSVALSGDARGGGGGGGGDSSSSGGGGGGGSSSSTRGGDIHDDDAAALATRFAREAVRRGLPPAAAPPRPSALVPPPVALTAALEALQAGDVPTAYAFTAPPPGAQAAEARGARSDWTARPGGDGVTFLGGGVAPWAAAVLGITLDGGGLGGAAPAAAAAPPPAGVVLLHAAHVALDGPPVFWEPAARGGGPAAAPDGEPWAEEDRLVQLVRVWPAAAPGGTRPPPVLVRVGMVRQAEGAYRGCWLVEGVATV